MLNNVFIADYSSVRIHNVDCKFAMCFEVMVDYVDVLQFSLIACVGGEDASFINL